MTKISQRISIVVILSIALTANNICLAATKDNDFEIWSSAGITWDIKNDWTMTFEQSLRFDNDAGSKYQQYSDIGFIYSGLVDWLHVGLNYRRIFGKGRDDGDDEDRPYCNAIVYGEMFGCKVRNRFRLEYRDQESEADFWRFRSKFTINRPFEHMDFRSGKSMPERIKPYVADEIFIDFDGEGFSRNRVYAGLSLMLTEHIEGDIYYILQTSNSDDGWQNANILGFNVTFHF